MYGYNLSFLHCRRYPGQWKLLTFFELVSRSTAFRAWWLALVCWCVLDGRRSAQCWWTISRKARRKNCPVLAAGPLVLAPGLLVMGPDLLLLKEQDPHLMELSPELASTVKDMKARKMVSSSIKMYISKSPLHREYWVVEYPTHKPQLQQQTEKW